jgi:hypothetical protein
MNGPMAYAGDPQPVRSVTESGTGDIRDCW